MYTNLRIRASHLISVFYVHYYGLVFTYVTHITDLAIYILTQASKNWGNWGSSCEVVKNSILISLLIIPLSYPFTIFLLPLLPVTLPPPPSFPSRLLSYPCLFPFTPFLPLPIIFPPSSLSSSHHSSSPSSLHHSLFTFPSLSLIPFPLLSPRQQRQKTSATFLTHFTPQRVFSGLWFTEKGLIILFFIRSVV